LEAQEVIHLIKEIQTNQPGKSIGVVTFNYHQQELIYSLIQEGVGTGYLQNDERLIVKNIENIQGDERDIIIFSVGYAPDEKGKLQMNFGSLSAENGEKRLNVAITRAKDKVYILSSITPDKLLVENTLNEGPKLFKKYLEQVKNNTISTQNTTRTYEWFECLSMKYHVTL
jgi:superfamily I DNA and/or RNA helicase